MHNLINKSISTGLICTCLMVMLCRAELPLAAQTLYQADFDGPPGTMPTGWQAWGGSWSLVQDDSTVFQQTQTNYRGFGQAGQAWSDYDVQVTVRPVETGSHWGVGVVGYWQPDGSCYRLSNYEGMLALWRERQGVPQALSVVDASLQAEQVYNLRLALRSEEGGTVLGGKIWAAVETEPEGWQIVIRDEKSPLRQGRAGLFTGRAAAQFYDFQVKVREADGQHRVWVNHSLQGAGLPTGAYWTLQGGHWEVPDSHQPLRQTTPGLTSGFRSAAYAIYSGFMNCTVQAEVKVASGSRSEGCGLTAYWQSNGSGYLFGQQGGSSLMLARRTVRGNKILAEIPFVFKKDVWYVVKLRLQNGAAGVQLQGKVWPMQAGEPTQWQLETTDSDAVALPGGEVALWCIDDVCSFDGLVVTANP